MQVVDSVLLLYDHHYEFVSLRAFHALPSLASSFPSLFPFLQLASLALSFLQLHFCLVSVSLDDGDSSIHLSIHVHLLLCVHLSVHTCIRLYLSVLSLFLSLFLSILLFSLLLCSLLFLSVLPRFHPSLLFLSSLSTTIVLAIKRGE